MGRREGAYVGVRPEAHGRGVGRRLVEDAFAAVQGDAGSSALVLDTENEANVGRDERWGFTLTASVELDGLRAFVLRRPRA